MTWGSIVQYTKKRMQDKEVRQRFYAIKKALEKKNKETRRKLRDGT